MSCLEENTQAFVTRLAEALAGRPDFGIPELMEEVNAFLDAEASSLFVLDSTTGELACRYAAGPVSHKMLDVRMPVGQGVVGWVVEYSEDLIVPSTGLDDRFYSGVDERTGFKTLSIVCVPVLRAGKAVGAIEAMNKMTGHFNDDDICLLKAVAGLVADRM